MKIALNAQQLLNAQPAGPERYAYELYRALSQIDAYNNYTLYFNQPHYENFFKKMSLRKNFEAKYIPQTLSWTHVDLYRQLKKDQPNIYFTPVHTMPILPLPKTTIIGMIHGLEYKFRKPETILKKVLWGKAEEWLARNAAALIVPTINVKDQIVAQGWRSATDAHFHVIPEGVDGKFLEVNQDKETKPYFLSVSTINPRKNIVRMVEGFAKFRKQNPQYSFYQLYIVGKNGEGYQESLKAPEKYQVQNNVRFLGRVDEDKLLSLYQQAQGFVNVSLEEGFGLPLLEALATGTPVLASQIKAHQEIGQDLPIFVDPYNTDQIAQGFLQLITPDISKILRGRERARKFTWKITAEKVLAIFENTHKNS